MFEQLRGRKPALIDMDIYRQSAVVIPLIEKEDGYHVLFEVRAIGLKHQPGEVCFPGGGCEGGETPEAGALRELCEELLVKEEQLEMIAPMDIFVSPFNMIIYPYMGILKNYHGEFNTDEVLEVFTVPLEFFMTERPKAYDNKVYTQPPENFPWDKVAGGEKYRWSFGHYPIYFYEYNDRVIWGITARIMRDTVRKLKSDERKKN